MIDASFHTSSLYLSDSSFQCTAMIEERNKLILKITSLFERVIAETNSLSSASKKNTLNICMRIRNRIQALVVHMEFLAVEVEKKIKASNQNLLDKVEEQTVLYKSLEANKREKSSLKFEIEGLKSSKNMLNNEVGRLNDEITELREKIDHEKEKRREIRGISILSAIVMGVKFEVAEEVAEAVSYLVSEKKDLKSQLNSVTSERNILKNRLNSLSNSIGEINKKIDIFKTEIGILNKRISECNDGIKNLGKTLTKLRNTQSSLKNILAKQELSDEVDTIKELIKGDSLPVEMIADLSTGLTAARNAFERIPF